MTPTSCRWHGFINKAMEGSNFSEPGTPLAPAEVDVKEDAGMSKIREDGLALFKKLCKLSISSRCLITKRTKWCCGERFCLLSCSRWLSIMLGHSGDQMKRNRLESSFSQSCPESLLDVDSSSPNPTSL